MLFAAAQGGAGLALLGHCAQGTAAASVIMPELAEPWAGATAESVSKAAVTAIEYLVANGLDSDLPRRLELELLQRDPALRADIAASVSDWFRRPSSQRIVLPSASISVLKPDGHSCRQFASLDALDATRYLAAAILVAEVLEPRRVPAGLGVVFSHRFSPRDGALFDPRYDLGAFHAKVPERLETTRKTWLVSTDIQNFFASVDFDHLTGALASYNVDATLATQTIAMLRAFTSGSNTGLPTGPAASFILAECLLAGVDRELRREGVDFVRFCDDYRFFAPSEPVAGEWLQYLRELLAARALTLNSRKTSVNAVSRSDYAALLEHTAQPGLVIGSARVAQLLAQTEPKKPPKQDRRRRSPPQPDDDPPRYSQGSRCRRLKTCDIDRLTPYKPASLREQLERTGLIEVADFRILLEWSFHENDHATLIGCLELLPRSPHLVPYFAAFAIRESGNIPEEIRNAIADQFARRLNANQLRFEYEFLSTILLLGSPAYERADSLYAALAVIRERNSPVLFRLAVATLSDRLTYDDLAPLLASRDVEMSCRRAVLKAMFAHIDPEQRLTLVANAGSDIREDPFCRSLMRSVALSG
jgi:hypothetical protein